jgi:hypothetical protein
MDPEAVGANAPATAPPKPKSTVPPAPVPPTSGPNLISNPSFEDDGGPTLTPKAWEVEGGERHWSTVGRFGRHRDGDLHLTQWRYDGHFDATAGQKVSGLTPGTYVAWAWFRARSTVERATLTVSGTGADNDPSADIPAGGLDDWTLVKTDPFPVTTDSVTVQIHSVGPAQAWVYVDDVHLHRAG